MAVSYKLAQMSALKKQFIPSLLIKKKTSFIADKNGAEAFSSQNGQFPGDAEVI